MSNYNNIFKIYHYIKNYKGKGYESPRNKHIYIPYVFNESKGIEIYINLNTIKLEKTVIYNCWTKLGRDLFYKPKIVNI